MTFIVVRYLVTGSDMLLHFTDFEVDDKQAFGTLLTTLRIGAKKKITQALVIAHLPGWTVSSYSRLENGEIAPRYDQLCELYHALRQAGLTFSPRVRLEFVDFARRRIALQGEQRQPPIVLR